MGTIDFFFGYLKEDYPSHYHDCYEFHYVLEGTGSLQQEGESIPFSSDLLLVSPPGKEHVLKIDRDVTFYFVRYKPDGGISESLKRLSSHYRLTGESRTIFSRLRTLLEGDEDSRRAGEHLFLYLLFNQLGNKRVESYNQAPIIKVQNYMAENLFRRITLQELADHVHLEKHYLCRLFKKCTHFSPLVYFERLKMDAACSMIEQGGRGYRIAEDLGFCDETYFSRRFKKVTGMSPGEFRKRAGALWEE